MKGMLLLLGMALALGAQTPAFEVASIKSNRSGEGGSSIRASTGRITMVNVPLRKVTLWAYGIPDDREYALSGPDWLSADRFDIQATFPADATAQVREMTRRLLADRFKMVLHKETRQQTVYALVAAKNGPKLQAVTAGQASTSSGPGQLDATKITMHKLADLLSRMMGRQVVDATGLDGVFDFTLRWSPEESQKTPPPDDSAPPVASSGPSLFSALQEQLGLKLESRKEPVEVLVVDHVERAPVEN